MTKILYKQNPLENKVIVSIDNSLVYLEQAVREIYSIDIPSDFNESRNLQNCVNEIKNVKNSLTNLKSWSKDSITTINNALNDTKNVASLLPKPNISSREKQ